MPVVHLKDRALVDVTGPEAEHFLQNIITTDLDGLGAAAAKPGALLSPQGKILFDFLVSRLGDGLRLECRADIADDLRRRLILYRLRAKIEIGAANQQLVAVAWETESSASQPESGGLATDGPVRDLRFSPPALVMRHHGVAPPADAPEVDWHAFRIAAGIAESGTDFQLGDAFPHDVLLDQTGGVGFRKGCYVGQEVVSRMQHRGTGRRRVLVADAGAELPEPGTEITSGGRSLGQLGSVTGRRGLAMVRIDRVKDAMDAGVPVMAGDVPVTLTIPGWANFSFPDTASGTGGA